MNSATTNSAYWAILMDVLRRAFVFNAVLCAFVLTPGATFAATSPARHGQSSSPPPAWVFRMMAWPGGVRHQIGSTQAAQIVRQDFKSILKNMAHSAAGLYAGNPGQSTRQAQRRIIQTLTDLIRLAESGSCHSGGAKPGHKAGGMSLKRSRGGGVGSHPLTPSRAARHSYVSYGSSLPVEAGRPFHSSHKQWGNLPPRARSLIINAMHNESLPAYRRLVHAYYRALGRMNRKSRH